jgi:hypothetical protein
MLELLVRYDADRIAGMVLALTDPARAAKTRDEAFEVTVVAPTGVSERADFATAVALTFLREALGCPMTRAGELYARLLKEGAPMAWGGSQVGLREVPIGDSVFVGLEVAVG